MDDKKEIVGAKARKKIYDAHLRTLLKDDVLKLLQSGQLYQIKLEDLAAYDQKLADLEGVIDAIDTGEAGTHKSRIIVANFNVFKKGRTDTEPLETYKIYLKNPITPEAEKHVHSNWRYNAEAWVEDAVSIITLCGGNGLPKTHAYSEDGGKSLLELAPEERLEDTIILAYTLGVSVKTLEKLFGKETLEKFADPERPTKNTLLDTLVMFPESYLSASKREITIKNLKDALSLDEKIDLDSLIASAKNYTGSDEAAIRARAESLELTDARAVTIPAEHKGREDEKPTHHYKDYENALQKGVNRLLQETAMRVEHVEKTYESSRQALLQRLGEFDIETGKGIDKTAEQQQVRDVLKEVEHDIDTFQKHRVNFEALRKQYENAFDSLIPTVSCPVDLIQVLRNLRISKQKKDGKIYRAQGNIIDQWLMDSKTFRDLRGSPIMVYYMLKRVTETVEDVGLKELLGNVCCALEKEFVSDDARINYWMGYREPLEKIVDAWHYWRNMRSIADRKKIVYAHLPLQNIAERTP